jgi:D-3-phosphoglycerate dehydrogenase
MVATAATPDAESVEPLIADLLEWIGPAGRPYPEVMDAWRTSCPRFPIWEEANDRGLVVRKRAPECGGRVFLTTRGRAWLEESARTS